MTGTGLLIVVTTVIFSVLGLVTLLSHIYTLNIKARPVGNGQHGTARWASKKEIEQMYEAVEFTPDLWRKGKNLPKTQGIIVGCKSSKTGTIALVDSGDVHCMMIGAAGVGKTAYYLYPNLEYACASGMSFLSTDTKGDIYRNYGPIARDKYGYKISVIDLRNPSKSDGNNLLQLVKKYMDLYEENPEHLEYKAKAEKYAKIISKTIILSGMGSSDFGQNAFFYDSAEGLISATILLIAEFCPKEKCHIVSVFKIIQELLAPGHAKGRNKFQEIMDLLPSEHKAKWLAGAALNTAEQAMSSVMSTALSRLLAFLDSEMEQVLCHDIAINAEQFCNEKCAIFLVLPEEDTNKYFMISLILQQLYREILAIADEQGGKLKKRVIFYCDEYGTLPKIESAEVMFSASRSRRLSIMAIIQSLAQLEKNYGKEGAEIIVDNTQLTIFGGFAPNSSTAEALSKALGSQTVLSGSVNRGKNDPSQSLQMIERPLLTTDELKSMPKGEFIVMKTGNHPIKTHLKLYFKWGIKFDKQLILQERGNNKVEYASKSDLIDGIFKKYHVNDVLDNMDRKWLNTQWNSEDNF